MSMDSRRPSKSKPLREAEGTFVARIEAVKRRADAALRASQAGPGIEVEIQVALLRSHVEQLDAELGDFLQSMAG